MNEEVGIVEFAKSILNKYLFDYEEKILEKYEELRTYSSYTEWVRPPERKNQYIYNIWMCYHEYLNGTLDLDEMKISNLKVV